MANALLPTKTGIPLPPRHPVHRPRLIEALESEIPNNKLIVVSAPAGYGKTTLLIQWARSTRLPVAWLTLNESDSAIDRFFRYLLSAWEASEPTVQDSPLAVLLSGMSPDTDALLAAFINAALDAPDDLVFVLDDYHLIADTAVHEAMDFLLEHLPPNIHFVLASRGEPPLALARYRAHGEMVEYGVADLCFLPDETNAFLNDRMGLELAPEDIDSLQAQLEGWVAGLQLVALSLRRHLTSQGRPEISGRHRFIADYLSEDVLAHLPDGVRRFLLQTSVLDQLCGPLCEAVTGEEGGQEMLETLEREGLFIVPLDDRREWFRYHHLFRDFLRGMLRRRHPDEVPGLHRRAARWHFEHDLPDLAFPHAVASEDAACVIEILERYFQAKLIGGEFRLLKAWLDSIPDTWYREYPLLGLAQSGFLLFTGQLDACIRHINEIEAQFAALERDERDLQLARVSAVRCSVACFQNNLDRAKEFADRALEDLPAQDHFFRGIIYGSLGDTYRRNGRWEEARECYLSLLDVVHIPAFRLQSAHVFGALADLELRQGALRSAFDYWERALAAIQRRENWGRLPLPLIGWVYIRMGEILYEWNKLAQATDYLAQGLSRAELGGDVRAMIAGYLIAGRLQLTRGNLDTATEYLDQARSFVDEAQFPHWASRFERFQLELWLAEDRLRAAVNWSDAMLAPDAAANRAATHVTQLAVCRVLIVKGDAPSLDRALALLEELLETAGREGRSGITIETMALQGLAHARRGNQPGAMTALEKALRLAEPEGYIRVFADLGPPMARLLHEAADRGVMPDYVEIVLNAFRDDLSSEPAGSETLLEPLTDREKEVLDLMAAGLTNKEIGEALVISPGTVKKHAANIYGKLGVGSRTEAAARARELGLLADR